MQELPALNETVDGVGVLVHCDGHGHHVDDMAAGCELDAGIARPL